MSIDPQQQRYGGMNFDHMPYQHSPQFTNPWSSAPSQTHSLYASHHNLSPMGLKQEPQQQHSQRLESHVPMGTYANVPVTSASADLLSPNRAVSMVSYGNQTPYSSAPSPVHDYTPAPAPYQTMGYAPAPVRSTYALPQHQDSRRLSHPGLQQDPSRAFGDAIDASRGMAMGQDQITPRNIYGGQGRVGRGGSGDAYGFPTQHSTSSSMSSSGSYPSYYGSVDSSSVSDYSNGSDIESSSRTLPRPSGLLSGGMPPAPQSMMGQFSSKVSSSTQKKHKCKVCDKRFTRPSSLQTHMYSHTGEKPFSCEVEGCGRHFSVVSNLRRHRKVHKGDARSEAGSEDHHSDD